MLQIAKEWHAGADFIWKKGSLPDLSGIDGEFDVILLSAVWMHVPLEQRGSGLARLVSLLAPGGRLHITLRSELMDAARGMYKSSAECVHLRLPKVDIGCAMSFRRNDQPGGHLHDLRQFVLQAFVLNGGAESAIIVLNVGQRMGGVEVGRLAIKLLNVAKAA